MKYFFHFENQLFDIAFNDQTKPKNGFVEVTKAKYDQLLNAVNMGLKIFEDLTCSGPKPSPYHIWGKNGWYDPRTPDQKRAEYLLSLKPLTRRQFKLALLQNNLLDEVEKKMAEIEDPFMRNKIQIEYNESLNFERNNESVLFMTSVLNITEEKVDKMWEQAMTL
ncbi:hypothetical protein [Acinetobacter baumannii]|uniref:hypothetical protein n=1 Tax=Acinetobacter baumannii TaxID=470 RepID=UPI0023422A35|nr:hypothetical protein [Acinetobacter baumannii]HCE0841710.1 hypothetical protein [Acinetobacter baumannii]